MQKLMLWRPGLSFPYRIPDTELSDRHLPDAQHTAPEVDDVILSLHPPRGEDRNGAWTITSAASWSQLWGWEMSMTSISFHPGQRTLLYYRPLSRSPEQGFSTVAAAESPEGFVKTQIACFQIMLWEQMHWRNKISLRFVLVILHGIVFCFWDPRVFLLLSPSCLHSRVFLEPMQDTSSLYHFLFFVFIFITVLMHPGCSLSSCNFRSFRSFYWVFCPESGNIFLNY